MKVVVALLKPLGTRVVACVVRVAAASKVQVRDERSIPCAIGATSVRRRASLSIRDSNHLAVEVGAALRFTELRHVLRRPLPLSRPGRATLLG